MAPPEPLRRDDPASAADDDRYWVAAKRPVQILVFLLPLVLAYEICLALLLPASDGAHVNTVEAHKSLLMFFSTFGIAPRGGLFLGGLVIVVVLLLWQVLARARWRIDPLVTVLMAAEALLLTIPLLIISRISADPPSLLAGAAPVAFGDLDIWSQMAISVGAGLYEELLFRMVLIALVHTLLVDVGRAPHAFGAIVAVAVSALAFTWYHDLRDASGAVSPRRVIFYLIAGLYFGAVYTLRGFGLVVGTHALYDIITVLLPASGAGEG